MINCDKYPIPIMGILAWDNELDQIPGNLIHPETFSFCVEIIKVPGACYNSVVVNPDSNIISEFIKSAKILESKGVKYIISTTGLSVIFQKYIANSVNIPVFTSALLLIPLISNMFNENTTIGIITVDINHLTNDHLKSSGITNERLCIVDIQNTDEFIKLAIDPQKIENKDKFKNEIVNIASGLVDSNKNIKSIVIEVSGICAFSGSIREKLNIPVFDIIEFSYMLNNSYLANRW